MSLIHNLFLKYLRTQNAVTNSHASICLKYLIILTCKKIVITCTILYKIQWTNWHCTGVGEPCHQFVLEYLFYGPIENSWIFFLAIWSYRVGQSMRGQNITELNGNRLIIHTKSNRKVNLIDDVHSTVASFKVFIFSSLFTLKWLLS